MGWPRLGSVLLTDSVTVQRNTWGSDGDGGRVITSFTQTSNVPAAVQPGDPERELGGGLSRVTMRIPYTIDFQSDVNLRADDEIIWDDPDTGRSHTIDVLTYVNLGSGSQTYQATGVERI